MAETVLIAGRNKGSWLWYDIIRDLKIQGGLEEVWVEPNSNDGEFDGNRFYFSWEHGLFFILEMRKFSQKLVDAFSAVLEYRPFCSYRYSNLLTVEWVKNYPEARFTKLQSNPEVKNLKRIVQPNTGGELRINLDELQQEIEKLLALLKDRQPGMMGWNMFLNERLNKVHTLISSALKKRVS